MAKELHENKDTEERLILVGIELEDKDSPVSYTHLLPLTKWINPPQTLTA